jgi:uncharacterized LabA/DUF88 family protein
MNSDQLTPDTLSPADTVAAPAGETTTPSPRRSRGRRATTTAVPAADAGPEMSADVTSDTGAPAPSRRRRRSATSALSVAPGATDTAAEGETSALEAPSAGVIDGVAPRDLEMVQPLNMQNATGDVTVPEAPLSRSRRRRGRGGRAVEPAALVDVDLPLDAEAPPPSLNPVEPELLLDGATLDAVGSAEFTDGVGTDLAAAPGATPVEGASGSGRRRRRRGRGNRGNGLEAGDADADIAAADDAEDVDASDTEDSLLFAPSPAFSEAEDLEPAVPTSPAVRRRFDHSSWRERLGLGVSAPPLAAAPASVDAIATARLAPSPAPTVPGSTTPPAFDRSDRERRFGARQPYPRSGDTFGPGTQGAQAQAPTALERTQPEPVAPVATASIPTIPTPAARAFASPITTPASTNTAGVVSAPPGGPIVTPSTADITPLPAPQQGGADARLVERLERLMQTQSGVLQQQGQALQALTSTMAALQGAIERIGAISIGGGMPRAGMFVDAPNIVYAAENARVNIDYGRMLDFLGRGREMVHSIVYAPVTEDTGYRFEQQRFVAPFLNKGYKMVTKPLKRFPDGTAKGNFDIELAIDIVTMSQRLDVVILISGDSDFSRLVELIQSRGVRVEVVSFASNVSWELVQMADVFIDVGQYINEFRAI